MYFLKRTIPEQYYNGNVLLSQTTRDGKEPSIFMSNTNRTAGKTTFFQLVMLDEVLEKKNMFVLISRTKTEMENPEVMFDDVVDIYFPDKIMTSKDYVKRLVKGIYLDKQLVGYAVCLKDTSALKKYSSIFAKCDVIFMDEVQPEDGIYLKDEVSKFKSLITTIARGGGKQSRSVRVYMASNNITVMNPYFLNLQLYKVLDENMDFSKPVYIRGDSYVCEFLYNQSAGDQLKNNGAISAFTTSYDSLTTSAEFMIKSGSFIEPKISGKTDYLFTLKYKGLMMGVRKLKSKGIIYITKQYDPSFKTIMALTATDHDELTIQLQSNTFLMGIIRNAYAYGKLRFGDLEVKNALIELLGIDYYR